MNQLELIRVDMTSERPTVSGRDLHEALEIKTSYKDWFPRMCEYGFSEGVDFNPLKNERVQVEGNRDVARMVTDHQLTIEMAKEICMIQRTEQGRRCRQYFLDLERQWNTPEAIMSRALRLADHQIKQLKAENADLTVDNQIMRPKSEYFDALVERNLLTNFRETAKQLALKEKDFIRFLMDKKYVYRDKKGKLQPYAGKSDGLFEVKECFNDKTQWSGTQTLITPKGRETFRLLIQ